MNHFKNFRPNLITIVFTAFCLLSAFTSNAAEPEASVFMDMDLAIRALQTKVNNLSPGIVSVVSYDITGAETGIKSGVFIDKNGIILTNADFLKDAYSAEVLTESGRFDNVTILIHDHISDLALLKTNATNSPALEMDLDYRLNPEERVIIIGKSNDFKRTVSEGFASKVYDLNELSDVFDIKTTLSILLLPESTDGAVFNMSGKIIGFMFNKNHIDSKTEGLEWLSENEEISAISVKHIKIFLDKDYTERRLRPAKARVWHLWLLKELKAASINSFVFLYQTGFTKMLIGIFLIILFISLIQYIYLRIRKTSSGHKQSRQF